MVRSIVETEIQFTTKKVDDLDKKNKDLVKRIGDCEKSMQNMDEKFNTINQSNKSVKTVSDNNLKYLINIDRN